MKKNIMLAVAGAVVTLGLSASAEDTFNYNSKTALLRAGGAAPAEASMTAAQYSSRWAVLKSAVSGKDEGASFASASYSSKASTRGAVEMAPVK